MPGRDREVTFESIALLTERQLRSGGIIKLQLVRWNNGKPKIEKREWYRDDDNNEKCGKAQGLDVDDLDVILSHAAELHTLMAATGTQRQNPITVPTAPTPAPVPVQRTIVTASPAAPAPVSRPSEAALVSDPSSPSGWRRATPQEVEQAVAHQNVDSNVESILDTVQRSIMPQATPTPEAPAPAPEAPANGEIARPAVRPKVTF